jgi:type II secretory ATPase GspE/PulE/Tfp pilus assembly ATPase PilB-like protein
MKKEQTTSLGEILLRQGVISEKQLAVALGQQAETRERLGELLIRLGLAREDDLIDALCSQLGFRRFDPAIDPVDPEALALIPQEFARRHRLTPLSVTESELIVAIFDPLDVEAIDELNRIARRTSRKVAFRLAPVELIEKAREESYGRIEGSRIVHELIDRVEGMAGGAPAEAEVLEKDDVEAKSQDAGVIRLVDSVIAHALQEGATDIHLEPQERGLLIRYRVDGLLFDGLQVPRSVHIGVISRLKVMANMDIAERRAAQDGRFSYRAAGHQIDVRVSAIPTIHGEKLVLRLLDKSGIRLTLKDLGYSDVAYASFLHSIHRPYGMVLLSGPTGSGKTTTLYAALLEIRNQSLNITTVEDPVEYRIDRINQVQVNEHKDLTFANALRSFLRQDPDVIMVGEIRDRETAEIGVRAALTGHLVFSTIHANDAPASATRLVSMGVEPFMAASALTLVGAQRLVRRNCTHCLEEYKPNEEVLLALGIDAATRLANGQGFLKGAGCEICKRRGYRGRIAVVEAMPLSPALREAITSNRPAGEIRKVAYAEGMIGIREDGIAKACKGLTTVEEIVRVCLGDE